MDAELNDALEHVRSLCARRVRAVELELDEQRAMARDKQRRIDALEERHKQMELAYAEALLKIEVRLAALHAHIPVTAHTRHARTNERSEAKTSAGDWKRTAHIGRTFRSVCSAT